MENLKKVHKIGDTIEVEELEKVSKGITKKALKVIAASGNMYAFNILENKDISMFEDLCQTVAVALIENNYIITKDCYRIVNNMLYNYKKSQLVLHIDNEDEKNEIERNGYIEFLTMDYTQKTSQKSNVTSLQSIYNMLTPRQAEILKIYSNLRKYTAHGGLFRSITPSGTECLTRYKTQVKLYDSITQKSGEKNHRFIFLLYELTN